MPEIPELVLMPREAFYSDKNKVPFKEKCWKNFWSENDNGLSSVYTNNYCWRKNISRHY